MKFEEAWKALQNGKKIKRPCFKGYWFMNPETGVFTIHLENGKDITYGKLGLTVMNIMENDWEIVE